MRKIFVLLILVSLTVTAWCQSNYDFSDVCSTGQTLYYKVIDDATVSVTYGCTNNHLTGNLDIPSTVSNGGEVYTVTAIGNSAFEGCTGLTSITIPNSVTSLGNYAFSSCTGLTSITIPNSVTTIRRGAFCKCTGLTSITIPSSITLIASGIISGCDGIASITVDGNNPNYDSRDNCNAIIETSTNKLITGCRNTVIPSSVTSIGSNAFSDCTGLTSIVIPNSVTSIGYEAFAGCTGLTVITIPSSITSIGNGIISGCDALASIIVDENNPNYDSRDNCNAIIETSTNKLVVGCRNTIIPSSVTSIGDHAFRGCTGLTSIVIPNSVTSMGGQAFSDCTGLTSLDIPNSVTTIGDYVFSGCTSLSTITLPNTLSSIVAYMFYGCSSLSSITIPNSVTSIGGSAFYNCSGLSSVSIPNSVSAIPSYAFTGCTGLTSITIPNSVTSIALSAFYGCTGLTSITIPSSVTSIGTWAFGGCPNLSSIVVESGNAVYDSRDNCNAIIKTDENKLVVGCQSTNIPNTVTVIGESALYEMTELTSMDIPNTVTTIEDNAFWGMTGLTDIHIPASVTSIGIQLLSDCSGLASITVDANNPNYDSRDSCNAIMETSTNTLIAGCQNTVIPTTTEILEENAFFGCTGLASITIPESVDTLRGWVFYNCTGLTTLTFPASVNAIGDHVLDGCINLTYLCSWNETPPTLAGSVCDAFNGIDEDIPVYIPFGTTAAYQEAWPYFTNFIESNVGIEQYETVELTVYPNPTTGIVILRLSPETCFQTPEIQLFDMSGRKLQNMVVMGEMTHIDLSNYATGIYIIKLMDGGKVVAVRKVVKQ